MLIPGFHSAVQSLPAGPKLVTEVWIANGRKGRRVALIKELARRYNIPVISKAKAELDRALQGISHQGFAVVAEDFRYSELEQLALGVGEDNDEPILLVADHITDEGNLASIIRTSAFFGVRGIVIPKDRSAAISPRVLKRAVGCHLYLGISRVVNLSRALDFLARHGYWIIGTAGKASKSVYEYDWSGPIALVVGNEEKGLGQAVRKKCHDLVGIPSYRDIDSLNVGVATGIILAQIAKAKGLAPRSHRGIGTQCTAPD